MQGHRERHAADRGECHGDPGQAARGGGCRHLRKTDLDRRAHVRQRDRRTQQGSSVGAAHDGGRSSVGPRNLQRRGSHVQSRAGGPGRALRDLRLVEPRPVARSAVAHVDRAAGDVDDGVPAGHVRILQSDDGLIAATDDVTAAVQPDGASGVHATHHTQFQRPGRHAGACVAHRSPEAHDRAVTEPDVVQPQVVRQPRRAAEGRRRLRAQDMPQLPEHGPEPFLVPREHLDVDRARRSYDRPTARHAAPRRRGWQHAVIMRRPRDARGRPTAICGQPGACGQPGRSTPAEP